MEIEQGKTREGSRGKEKDGVEKEKKRNRVGWIVEIEEGRIREESRK